MREQAKRMRIRDYVAITVNGNFVIGRITAKSDSTTGSVVKIKSNNGKSYSVSADAVMKATKKEYEEATEEAKEEVVEYIYGEDTERVSSLASSKEPVLVGSETEEAKEEAKEEAEGSMPSIMRKYRKLYITTNSVGGKKKLDCGDEVAEALRDFISIEDVYKITQLILNQADGEEPISVEDLKEKYSHLNNGQIRMCLGNRIRGMLKKYGLTLDQVL